jgi:hypothetical protein
LNQDAVNDTDRFYRTALPALCAWEHHEPSKRRFGADADAAWAMFRGHLDDADRIDLLIRDAAVKHPAAFAPRTVFAFADLPEDEPFGPRWTSPYGPDTGRRAWRETLERCGLPPRELWRSALEAWGVTPEPLELRSALDSTSRVLVVGTTAIAALAERFLDHREALDWGRQVVAVAAMPAGVQLAGTLPLCAGTKESARAWRITDRNAEQGPACMEEAGMRRPDIVVGSRQPTDLELRFVASLRPTA